MAQMVLTLYLAQLLQLVAAAVRVIHPKQVATVALVAVDKALLLAQAHLVRVTMVVLVKVEMLAVAVVAHLLSVVLVQPMSEEMAVMEQPQTFRELA
jgi:hypothetical protein